MILAKPPEQLTEKEVTSQAIGSKSKPTGLAYTLGWTCYHTLRSKGSTPGWPDWACVRERLVMIELKTEKGPVSDAQKRWIRALLAADVETYVVRPTWLDLLAVVLAARRPAGRVFGADAQVAHVELLALTRAAVA